MEFDHILKYLFDNYETYTAMYIYYMKIQTLYKIAISLFDPPSLIYHRYPFSYISIRQIITCMQNTNIKNRF
jgi:hypothetical protein